MLDVVAADKDEATPAVDRCLVDHGESRLTAARCATTKAAGAEPAQQPERQREQDEHHDHEEKDLEAALSFAE
jgi:ribosomal protein L12E/L44/L45/RPP1/RPP2